MSENSDSFPDVTANPKGAKIGVFCLGTIITVEFDCDFIPSLGDETLDPGESKDAYDS